MTSVPANLPGAIDVLPDTIPTGVSVVKNYINGKWSEAKSKKYIINKKPATNEIFSYIPRSSEEDVKEAVEGAKNAHKNKVWSGLTEEARAGFLDKIANKIEERFEEFAKLESEDCGKPISTARMIDIDRAVKNFRFFAGALRHEETSCHTISNTVVSYTLRRPVGIAGLITPWNLPLYLLSWKLAPALACGNCCVVKPSELTPMTATKLAEIIDEVGVPAGVFNLVHGYGAEVGGPIITHRDVNLISFTGGTKTGETVNSLAALQFKKVSLELGGKNSMIVFDDCDLDKAVQVAKRSGWANTGQVCLCTSRMFVHDSVYDEFIKRLTKELSEMKVGDITDPTTAVGSLISQEHRAKVEYYIDLAKQEGGKILFGGERPSALKGTPYENGAFLEPTLIADLSPTSRPSVEEIFGPVVTIHRFSTDDEVLEMANIVRYGLCATIFTKDLSRAHRFSDNLECGMVWVNTWLLRDLRAPFGGTKDSGIGREGGKYSMEFYSDDKNVCIQL